MPSFPNWVIVKLLKYFKQGNYSSIGISCFVTDDKVFYDFICDILELIKQHDEKRYLRVINELNWIANTRRIKVDCGEYKHSIKLCSIHCNLSIEQHIDDLIYFASVIIHEATHGYLSSKGFESTKERRVQIERICVAEGNRFLAKVAEKHPETSEKYIREFDPKDWQESWNSSKWIRFRTEITRIIKS